MSAHAGVEYHIRAFVAAGIARLARIEMRLAVGVFDNFAVFGDAKSFRDRLVGFEFGHIN